MDMNDLMQTQGQTHFTKQTDYGSWHSEFDPQSHLCFAGMQVLEVFVGSRSGSQKYLCGSAYKSRISGR